MAPNPENFTASTTVVAQITLNTRPCMSFHLKLHFWVPFYLFFCCIQSEQITNSRSFIMHIAWNFYSTMVQEPCLWCNFSSCSQKACVKRPRHAASTFCLKLPRWKVRWKEDHPQSWQIFLATLLMWGCTTPVLQTHISHFSSPIAVPALMAAAYEVLLLSLAKAHLFNRAGYIAACSFWWLRSDPHRSSLNLPVRQDHPPNPPSSTTTAMVYPLHSWVGGWQRQR